MRLVALIALSLSCLASAAMRKGPYLVLTADPTELAVHWQLDATAACTLSWGATTGYELGTVVTTESGSGANEHQHSRAITGLTAGALYYYRVAEAGGGAVNSSFRAAPPEGQTSLTIYALGESRARPDTFNQVCARILTDINQQPASRQTLVLHTGDFTSNGAYDTAWQNQLFSRSRNATTAMMGLMPLEGCRGDDEQDGSLMRKYLPYAYPSPPDCYHSFTYGPLLVVLIDDAVSMTAGVPQYTWLRDKLTNSTARWKIVVCHMPTWSCGPNPNVFSKQTVIHPYPILYSGVRMVLSSHNHYYSRAMADGIAYVTTGGAGAALDAPSLPSDSVVKAESAHHFLRIELAGDSLVGTAIRTDGSQIERFVVQLPPTGLVGRETELPQRAEGVRRAVWYDLNGRAISTTQSLAGSPPAGLGSRPALGLVARREGQSHGLRLVVTP